MIILETGEIVNEKKALETIEEIRQLLHQHDLTVCEAKYVLDQAKLKVENAKV